MIARLVAEMATMVGEANASRTGRWRLNAGNEMIVSVPGLNDDAKGNPRPVRLVIDLSTVKAKSNRIVALADHEPTRVVGYWDGMKAAVEIGIEGDFHVIVPANEVEAAIMPDAVRIAAQARAGVPLQVSVGAQAGAGGRWHMVPEDQEIEVNGRKYSGAGDLPLCILYGGEIYESSILTFGADSETGRVAAKKSTTPVTTETPMSDKLKALLGNYAEKHHGLVARCVAENLDEAAITKKVHAAEIDDKDAVIKAKDERIAQLEDENKSLKSKCDDYAQKGNEKQERETHDKLQLAAKSSDKHLKVAGSDEGKSDEGKAEPKTVTEAMAVLAKANPELKGFKLRAAARKAYPNAEER